MPPKNSQPDEPVNGEPVALAPKTAENSEEYVKARTESVNIATGVVRDAHREQYDDALAKAMAERGFLWEPRPTGKRRALLKMQALAAEYGLTAEDLAEVTPELAHEGAPLARSLSERAAEYGVVNPDAR